MMKDLIFIAGAPGSGKSTIAKALQKRLDCPLFEFGWIPEFRRGGERELTYFEEESLAFENLQLVAKNYVKHGFKNIIITDLNNDHVGQVPRIFYGYSLAIVTLRLEDESLLKARVLDESRSSEYRDWETALEINRSLLARGELKDEVFLEVDGQSVDHVVDRIVEVLN